MCDAPAVSGNLHDAAEICFSPRALSNFLLLEMKRSTGDHSREDSQGGPDNVSLAYMYTYD